MAPRCSRSPALAWWAASAWTPRDSVSCHKGRMSRECRRERHSLRPAPHLRAAMTWVALLCSYCGSEEPYQRERPCQRRNRKPMVNRQCRAARCRPGDEAILLELADVAVRIGGVAGAVHAAGAAGADVVPLRIADARRGAAGCERVRRSLHPFEDPVDEMCDLGKSSAAALSLLCQSPAVRRSVPARRGARLLGRAARLAPYRRPYVRACIARLFQRLAAAVATRPRSGYASMALPPRRVVSTWRSAGTTSTSPDPAADDRAAVLDVTRSPKRRALSPRRPRRGPR